MQVGSLGDIIFVVSEDIIKTLKEFEWGGSARIATHERHLDNALQEFTGIDPDTFSFSFTLSQYLGADPMSDIAKIFTYERTGKPVSLVIGTRPYGKYKWLIKSHKAKGKMFDGKGNMVSADVTVSLTEYTEG